MNDRELIIINRIVLPVAAPDRILIAPAGDVPSTSGDFVMDAPAAREMIASFQSLKRDLVIDLEHQTLGGEWASPSGAAPAQGWIKSLDWVDGLGIYASVEWTEEGAALIAKKQYRYLSPVVLVRKEDRRAVALHSVGLTNDPAIIGMKPIVNSSRWIANTDPKFESARWFLNLEATATEEQIMSEFEKYLSQMRELAGVSATADQTAIVAALKAKLDAGSGLRAAVCKAVDLDPAKVTKDEDILVAVHAARTIARPAGDSVTRAEYETIANKVQALTTENAALNSRLVQREADERIETARRAGKLTDAMLQPNSDGTNYFRQLAKDPAQWQACMDRMPAHAPADGRVVSGAPTGGSVLAGDRTAVINKAAADYAADAELQKLCSRTAYISDCLRQSKNTALSPEERKQYAA